MQSKQGISLLLIVYGSMYVQVVLSCYCPVTPFADSFCMSEYAMKARVLSETQTVGQESEGDIEESRLPGGDYNKPVKYTYEIKVDHVYRSTPSSESAVQKVVISGIRGCVFRLRPGATYLLMGYVSYQDRENGSPTLGVFCDVPSGWSDAEFENLKSNPPQCSENQGRARKNDRHAATFLKKSFIKN